MCWKCKNQIDLSEKIYRTSTCKFCKADLHCCYNCKFYDKGAHYDCRENIFDFVSEKESANFCDFFVAKADFPKENDDSVASFLALFGNEASYEDIENKTVSAKDNFDALFGD